MQVSVVDKINVILQMIDEWYRILIYLKMQCFCYGRKKCNALSMLCNSHSDVIVVLSSNSNMICNPHSAVLVFFKTDMICNPHFTLFGLPGVLLCPWACLIMAIGLSALILGLWPMHLIWTYYCIIRYSVHVLQFYFWQLD